MRREANAMDGLTDDEFDPLAPVYVDAVDEDDDPGSDHTAADPLRIVKVWIEPDGELTRVQVSPIWHRKVGHRSLDEVFNGVLAAAALHMPPDEPRTALPDLDGVDFSGVLRFGRDPLNTLRLALENVNRRWLEVAERRIANPPPQPQIVEVGDDEIRLRLDPEGRVASVSFDEEWLDDADVGEINLGVVRLARRARAAYVPQEPVRDELADLALEHEILVAGLTRMLSGKAPR